MQPNRLPFVLRIFLSASFLAILGCSGNTPYPVDFCLVSGNAFGEDPDMIPYTHVYEGTTIKFCCKPCLPKFEKNPEKYMADLKEEIEALAKESKD